MSRDLLIAAVAATALHAGTLTVVGWPVQPAIVQSAGEHSLHVVYVAEQRSATALEALRALDAPRLRADVLRDGAVAPAVEAPSPALFEQPLPPGATPGNAVEPLPAPPRTPALSNAMPPPRPPRFARQGVADHAEEAGHTDHPDDRDARGTQALALHNPPPAYPRLARMRGLEGTVVLHIRVLACGACGEILIARSSGHRVLDQAAASAARRWRFRPATARGTAIDTWVELPVQFRLEDS